MRDVYGDSNAEGAEVFAKGRREELYTSSSTSTLEIVRSFSPISSVEVDEDV